MPSGNGGHRPGMRSRTFRSASGTRARPDLPAVPEISFDSATGGHGLDFLAEGGTDTAINMVVNGTTVATTTVDTPTLIEIAYTGA